LKKITTLTWLTFCLSLLIFSLGISWQINRTIDFSYSFWYQTLDIDAHINQYAAENTQGKKDFVKTEAKQHYALFGQIVDGISQSGFGLADINYQVATKRQITDKERLDNINVLPRALLTNSEVVHLQDVSDLVDNLTQLWLINLVLLSLLIIYAFKSINFIGKTPTSNKIAITLFFIVLCFAFLYFFGVTEFFYYLHTLIFPDDHQWFFYYQESLMSTLMKAPDLFAGIAAALFIIASCIYSVIYHYINNTINTRKSSTKKLTH